MLAIMSQRPGARNSRDLGLLLQVSNCPRKEPERRVWPHFVGSV